MGSEPCGPAAFEQLGATGEDSGDARVADARATVLEFFAQRLHQLRRGEHALDRVARVQQGDGLLDHVSLVHLQFAHAALPNKLD
jgi:hypothetical protein